jgi:hypothetical protein
LPRSKSARPRPPSTQRASARGAPALRLALIRQLHSYVAMFVAPSLIFFAVTGALQTFRLPDDPAAPVLLQKLARLHKDDVFAVKPPRPARPRGGHEGPAPPKPAPRPATQAMKWFFAAISVGILATTGFGVWMALAHGRRKWLLWLLLIAGTAAPVLIALA